MNKVVFLLIIGLFLLSGCGSDNILFVEPSGDDWKVNGVPFEGFEDPTNPPGFTLYNCSSINLTHAECELLDLEDNYMGNTTIKLGGDVMVLDSPDGIIMIR